MSSSSKKAKKKWKPITIDAVLNTSVKRPTASWAEEVESELYSDYTTKKLSSIVLPTAPRAACDLIIDDSKIPPNGPFLAYLSNLPYEITEDDIAQQFNELKIVNVQLPKDDRQDRMKGFGYIEFKDKSNLLAALNEGVLTLKGRSVRISLPNDEEQNKDRGSRSGGTFARREMSDRNDRSERPLGEWRAAVPVPHDPDKAAPSRSSGVGFTRQPNRDRDSDRDRGGSSSGPFRDFGRGGFQSDSDKSGSQFSRAFRDRDDGGRSSNRDRDRDWGSNRPFEKRYERDDRMGRSAFGKKFDRDDRDREMKREPMAPVDREEPKTRPKIDIQPRTIPLDASRRTPEALPSSIFGGAKPVDTAKREMEIEAKMQTMTTSATRSRGHTPPLRSTPTSNRSRSSSISSLSSARRNEADSAETTNESNQSLEQPENDRDDLAGAADSEVVKPKPQEEFKQPENAWRNRSAALSAAPPAENSAANAPSTVIENVEAVEHASDSAATADTNTSDVEEAKSSTEPIGVSAANSARNDDEKPASRSNSHPEPRAANDQWTTYSRDSYESSQQYGGGRHGGGGSSRYSDRENKFASFNRRERRDNHRDRDGDRRPDNRSNYRNRDDHYGGGRNDSNSAFSSTNKFGHNRDGGRNKNDFGSSRRYDRDNGGGGYNSYRGGERSGNRSMRSSNPNLRDDGESIGAGSSFGDRHHEERKPYDERLIEGDTNAANDAHVEAAEEQPQAVDSRLKGSPEDAKPLENGNENGVEGDGAVVTQSTENIANADEQSEENSFKTRKKNKRKKNQERADETNEKEFAKPIEISDAKARNQKEDKKNADNNQSNEKTSNKNNAKAKETRTEKPPKKPREPRDNVSSMPKQKEEKAPTFQNKNRFQYLNSDD